MQFSVDAEILTLFPQMMIGVMDGTLGEVRPGVAAKIARMRSDAMARLITSIASPDLLTQHPHIGAWHDAYLKIGVKPKKFNPTQEAIARRLLRGKGWPDIHPLVDIYLINQAFHLLPHGGHDTSAINGDIRLRFSAGDERFEVSPDQYENTDIGEIVYSDDRQILTRRWNYRDCCRAQLSEGTQRFVLVVESPSAAITREALFACMQDLSGRYRECFEGHFSYNVLESLGNNGGFGLASSQS